MSTTGRNRSILAGLVGDAPVTETPNAAARPARLDTRFTGLSRVTSGDVKEKTLQLVDPARCRMWARHNRRYELLTEASCADLLEGLRSQGQQEFPAIVRRVADDPNFDFEVICGARRHWSVAFLRSIEHRPMKFLVEERDLDDEAAFRLSDIENRARTDISDYERAVDYRNAVDAYYGGVAQRMAERLEVSKTWLSRFLDLAKLPTAVIDAFGDIRQLRENHARVIKPLLAEDASRKRLMAEATRIAKAQADRQARGERLHEAASVVIALKNAASPSKPTASKPGPEVISTTAGETIFTLTRKGSNRAVIDLALDAKATNLEFEQALASTLQRLRA